MLDSARSTLSLAAHPDPALRAALSLKGEGRLGGLRFLPSPLGERAGADGDRVRATAGQLIVQPIDGTHHGKHHRRNGHRLPPVPRRRIGRRLLPYLLSLPALLVCIGILIPFFTAVYYSTLRFRLNLPGLKGFIGVDNYINFLTDAAFWNTVTDLSWSMPR